MTHQNFLLVMRLLLRLLVALLAVLALSLGAAWLWDSPDDRPPPAVGSTAPR